MPIAPRALPSISRRAFLEASAATLAAACSLGPDDSRRPPTGDGRIKARPGTPTGSVAPGTTALGVSSGPRDGLLRVPSGYRADRPAPLVMMLHGAGGSAATAIQRLAGLADDAGLVLVAIDSRFSTWDMMYGSFRDDVAFIDAALASVFSRCAVDPARITIEGFSDGASYSLSLGLTNGDLFSRIIAFSPGFMNPGQFVGAPRFYIAHGTADGVLPIESSSRQIVPELRRRGYDVAYHEFAGGHTVPSEQARGAVAWLSQ
jgi:phospholipase/carboxylesterase